MKNIKTYFYIYSASQIWFTLFWWLMKFPNSVGFFTSFFWSSCMMTPINLLVIMLLNRLFIIPLYRNYYLSVIIEIILFTIISYSLDFYLIESVWVSCNFNDDYVLAAIAIFMIIIAMGFIRLLILIFFKHRSSSEKRNSAKKSLYLKSNFDIIALLVANIIIGYVILHSMYEEVY